MVALCIRCQGKGSYLGLGMISVDCGLCKGKASEKEKAPSIEKIDRTSESYKKAIKDIMELNQNISRKEAMKIFDEAYVKL